MSTNRKLVDINYTISGNDGIHPLALNATIQTFAVFTKLWIYITIRIPETKEDKLFLKEGMKIVIDLEKALSGIQNNFIVSKILDMMPRGSDQDYKFPVKKVSFLKDHSKPN
jgi:hypothetical protein